MLISYVVWYLWICPCFIKLWCSFDTFNYKNISFSCINITFSCNELWLMSMRLVLNGYKKVLLCYPWFTHILLYENYIQTCYEEILHSLRFVSDFYVWRCFGNGFHMYLCDISMLYVSHDWKGFGESFENFWVIQKATSWPRICNIATSSSPCHDLDQTWMEHDIHRFKHY